MALRVGGVLVGCMVLCVRMGLLGMDAWMAWVGWIEGFMIADTD
jgi:hypothetical protein